MARPRLRLLEQSSQPQHRVIVVAAAHDLDPTGMPSDDSPAGTEHAGFHARLASIVNGTLIAPAAGPKRSDKSSPPIVVGGGPAASKAGTAVHGREQNVDVVEDRGTFGIELEPAAQGLGQRAQGTVVGGLETVADVAADVVESIGIVLALVDLEPQRERAIRAATYERDR